MDRANAGVNSQFTIRARHTRLKNQHSVHLFCGLLRSFIFRSPFRHKTEVLKVVCFIFRRQQQRREKRIKAATMPFFLPKRLQSATMCNLRPAKSTVFVLLPLSIIFLRTGTFQWISKIQAHLNASRDLPALHELPFIGHTNFFFMPILMTSSY